MGEWLYKEVYLHHEMLPSNKKELIQNTIKNLGGP